MRTWIWSINMNHDQKWPIWTWNQKYRSAKPRFVDPFLPRVVELAQYSSDRQTKVAACELLHSLVLYTLGRGAVQPGFKKKQEPMTRLYKRIFPALLKLACDVEQVSKLSNSRYLPKNALTSLQSNFPRTNYKCEKKFVIEKVARSPRWPPDHFWPWNIDRLALTEKMYETFVGCVIWKCISIEFWITGAGKNSL